jgi:hypothetical protein
VEPGNLLHLQRRDHDSQSLGQRYAGSHYRLCSRGGRVNIQVCDKKMRRGERDSDVCLRS